MLIDARHYDAGEFGFYIQTNGPVDAGHFRDFLDLVCGNSYGQRQVAPSRVEIIELAGGSIRGRLRAFFEPPWSKRKARAVEKLYRQNLFESKAALRQADAAELANAIAAEGNTIAQQANIKIARQNNIALATFLSGVIATIYANAPSSDAERIAKLMEIDGVSRIEIATKHHSWTIERQHVQDYRDEAAKAMEVERWRVSLPGLPRVGTTPPARARTPADAAKISDVAEATVIPSNLAGGEPSRRARGVDGARPAAPMSILDLTAGMKGQYLAQVGTITALGDLLTLAPEPGNPAGRPTIIVPPANYVAGNGDTVEVQGKLFQLPGPQDLMIATTIIRAE